MTYRGHFLLFATILFLLLQFSGFAKAQEEKETKQANLEASELPKRPNWPFSLNFNSKTISADDIQEIQIDENKVPVLQYWAKGKKQRGTIILLTAQGESPTSNRLPLPLSLQLSQLGWEVFVPAIPVADFKITPKESSIDSSNQSQNQSSEQAGKQNSDSQDSSEPKNSMVNSNDKAKSDTFFESTEDYQQWFSKMLNESIRLKKSQKNITLIVANQNSAYWLLDPAKTSSDISHLVIISPQIPASLSNDLEEKFNSQTRPLFAFINDKSEKDPFDRAFKQNTWQSNNVRIDRESVSTRRIDSENPIIARKISGWIDSQNRSN